MNLSDGLFIAEDKRFAASQISGKRAYQEDKYNRIARGTADRNGNEMLVVADGMGGHVSGDTASSTVVRTFFETFPNTTGSIPDRLCACLEAANNALAAAIDANPQLDGMGTTVVAVVVSQEDQQHLLQWISVGDSPLWLFRDGQLCRLNADHSMAAVLAGCMTEEEAATDPKRHVLRSAVMGDDIPLTHVSSEPDEDYIHRINVSSEPVKDYIDLFKKNLNNVSAELVKDYIDLFKKNLNNVSAATDPKRHVLRSAVMGDDIPLTHVSSEPDEDYIDLFKKNLNNVSAELVKDYIDLFKKNLNNVSAEPVKDYIDLFKKNLNNVSSELVKDYIDLFKEKPPPVKLEKSDRILLASDGLLTLTKEDIESCLIKKDKKALSEVTEALIQEVKAAKHLHQDNTTVLLYTPEADRDVASVAATPTQEESNAGNSLFNQIRQRLRVPNKKR